MRIIGYRRGRISVIASIPNMIGQYYSKTFNCQIGHDTTTVALKYNFDEFSMDLFGRRGHVSGTVIFKEQSHKVKEIIFEQNPTFFMCESVGINPAITILGWIY